MRELLLAAAAGLAAGCGPTGENRVEATVPVSGKVLLPSGQPLTDGKVSFERFASGNTPSLTADSVVKPDGAFSLRSMGKEGVPPGKYKVVIEPGAAGKKIVPAKYQDLEKTDLEIEISQPTTDLKVQIKG